MLTEIRVAKGQTGAYLKFQRRAQDWATVGVAAVRSNGDTRVALTNMGPTPMRASGVEEALAGGADAAAASERAAEGTSPPSDHNASAEFREHLARVHHEARARGGVRGLIGGLILAAGGGSRFGGTKQLAELDGRPLLAHAIDAMKAVPAVERIVVVVGSDAERVRAAAGPGVETVVAEDWDEGIAASLRTGIAALADADAVVLTLGDQPRVSPEAIEAVLAAGAPARAVYAGAPGHPVLIGRDLFPAVAELTGDQGARDLLAAHGVTEVDLTALGGSQDVDTPADLESL